jgi:hypothetical protein
MAWGGGSPEVYLFNTQIENTNRSVEARVGGKVYVFGGRLTGLAYGGNNAVYGDVGCTGVRSWAGVVLSSACAAP